MKKIFNYWIPLFIYIWFIVSVSITPDPPKMPDVDQIDKLAHFGAYCLMGFLFARALRSGTATLAAASSRVIVAVSFAASFAIGAGLEVWQSFIPERSAEVLDALANGAGGLTGAFVYERLRAFVLKVIGKAQG